MEMDTFVPILAHFHLANTGMYVHLTDADMYRVSTSVFKVD